MTRVLVVDDEIDTLNLLQTILEISGFEAVTTLNSTDAITLAEVEHPDCILLDIMMPRLDGFTLCKMMRLHPATADLPIVFVTAYSALDLDERRREAGADLVLPKPVGMDTLLETIGQATKLRGPGKKIADAAAAVEAASIAAITAAAVTTAANAAAAAATPAPSPIVTPEPAKAPATVGATAAASAPATAPAVAGSSTSAVSATDATAKPSAVPPTPTPPVAPQRKGLFGRG